MNNTFFYCSFSSLPCLALPSFFLSDKLSCQPLESFAQQKNKIIKSAQATYALVFEMLHMKICVLNVL